MTSTLAPTKARKQIVLAADYVRGQIGDLKPEVGIILGSGLGVLADAYPDAIRIPYGDIPGFPVSTVEGHSGQMVVGEVEGKVAVMLQGRFHFYEGYDLGEVTVPVRVMKVLGVQSLLVTNAAGGVKLSFKPGDLMIIKDHINMSSANPLRGKNMEDFGPRFVDMSTPYDAGYIQQAKAIAASLGIEVKEGIYQFNTGPSYETPAEVQLARVIGADAVGMSTVPEVITARHCGMRVLGISCITNMAAGIVDQPLSHDEVIETAAVVREDFVRLVKTILKSI